MTILAIDPGTHTCGGGGKNSAQKGRKAMPKIVHYEHHGAEVSVRADLKGQHREHCLCFGCSKFKPDNRDKNCPIANRVFQTCVDENIVSPVWECPEFAQK